MIELGQSGPAKALLVQALDEARAVFGDQDPRVAYAECSLATALISRHEHAPARKLLEHGIAVLDRAGDTTPYSVQLDAKLAPLLFADEPERAQRLAIRALAEWQGKAYWRKEYAKLSRWLKQHAAPEPHPPEHRHRCERNSRHWRGNSGGIMGVSGSPGTTRPGSDSPPGSERLGESG